MLQKISVEELCRKLKPIFGKKIDDVYLKYAMAETREEKEDITHMLSALYNKNLNELLANKVLLEPPPKESMDGDYPLATVSYAGKKLFPFSLREQDWPRHVCITGMSGSGKTTLAFNIITNFIKNDKPFLVFDWKKSFRPLLLASSDVMCFTIGEESVSNLFKININQPPKGIDPKEWINVLCDLLVEAFFASYGVHKVLLETLDSAFKEWGVYEGSENYPTWNHIKWYLEEKFNKTKGREAGWLESALRIASVLTFGNFGKVCNYKEKDGLSVEDLLNKKVILELNSLSNIEKKFFCDFVLTYIYKLKKARQKNLSGKFDYAILVDEAHNIFLKGSPHFTQESVTDMIYREMREYGISLICLDQHISKLSDTVKGNSACNIAFQQQLSPDIFDISGLMQLMEQKQFFSILPVGSAIVKLSERYPYPFLIEVSPVKLRESVVDDSAVKDRAKFHLMGIGVEKGVDEDFNRKLIGEKAVKVIDSYNEKLSFEEEPVTEPDVSLNEPSYPENFSPISFTYENPEKEIETQDSNEVEGNFGDKEKNFLTPVQKVLYEFVKKSLNQGKRLREIEDLLEAYKKEGSYTFEDVGLVINHALKLQFERSKSPKLVTPIERRKVYKQADIVNDNNSEEKPALNMDLTNEQKMFLSFLQNNNNQDYGTVDIYKKLGLSSRKGNKIKNELVDKNFIIIEEKKNDTGWKKIIKLSPSLH